MPEPVDATIATVLLLLLYMAAGFAVRERWNHKVALNPLKIIANFSGRASLSNAQVFFFTLIVLWLALYWVVHNGALVPINETVLGLLGIAVAGAGASKAADVSRYRVTAPNWAWAKKKGWIQRDFTRETAARQPKISDLFTSDQGFEVAKFQAVVFSLVIGIALLYNGATVETAKAFSEFAVPAEYLALIGISQGVYVGGKMVGANLYAELNQKLDKVRELELTFTSAVGNADAWQSAAADDKNMPLAYGQCAPQEHAEYMSAATEAGEIVGALTGVPLAPAKMHPELPPVA